MRPASLLNSFEPHRRAPRRRRTVTLSRPVVLLSGLAFLVLMAWSGATAWYFTSRDQVAFKLLEKQAALKRSYEEQVRTLRASLDQASQQGQDARNAVEARLAALLARQAAFEQRAALVNSIAYKAGVEVISLADPPTTGSTPNVVGPNGPVPNASAFAPTAPPANPFQLRLRPSEPAAPQVQSEVQGLEDGLERAGSTLANLETGQLRALETLLRRTEGQTAQLQNAIRTAGLNPGSLDRTPSAGMGGPFVPVAAREGPFENLATRTDASVQRLQRLRRSVTALPFAEPIDSEIDLSSGFGYRLDPFTRSTALHTGLDFKAEQGSLVRATGSGRVVTAEYSGAYGNMVEIEHANGVSSRYGHLSAIGVTVGQTVRIGSILGRVGSTGRSTGPHLHYETRIEGEAVDPQRFLRAGAQMASTAPASR